MRIGIVGWGLEGQSAYRYFGAEHEYLIANEEPRDDFPAQDKTTRVQFISAQRAAGLTGNVQDLSYLDGVDECDKIIYSVTTAKNLEKKFGKNSAFWAKATTIQHIFFEEVKTKNIIGVTGTKGKGTTYTIIYEMLKAAGKRAFLGGNIGLPVLDFVKDVTPDDWVVLELSNFQLYNLTYGPHIAVCLMIAPEHMDWHPDMNDYIEAKANLFRHQKPEDIAIYFAENEYSKKIAGYSPGQKIPYLQPPGAHIEEGSKIMINGVEVIDKSAIKLLGEHNLQNVCAALTAFWQAAQDREAARKVLSSFSGLEHRLEFVRELNGVKFYNDSFAATPNASSASLAAITSNKVMIIGGFDRHLPLEDFTKAIVDSKDTIHKIVLIGQSAERVAQQLASAGFSNFVINSDKDINEILSQTVKFAQPGDAVVLSPGFPSFDMFKNFQVRGEKFKEAVNAL